MSCGLISLSPGALLVFAIVLFFDTSGTVSALVPAAAAHELGHISALLCFGARIQRLRLEIFGLRLDYRGRLSGKREIIAAASGPIAGLAYFGICMIPAGRFFTLSGMISLFLSLFNLLPILPLDGGRISVLVLGKSRAQRVSVVFSLAIFCFGTAALFIHASPAPLLLATWLLLYSIQSQA